MNKNICLIICFIVGVIVFMMIRGYCSCNIKEGYCCKAGDKPAPPTPTCALGTGLEYFNPNGCTDLPEEICNKTWTKDTTVRPPAAKLCTWNNSKCVIDSEIFGPNAGDNCPSGEVPPHPCYPKPCKNGGDCRVKEGDNTSYECECKSPWTGTNCQKGPKVCSNPKNDCTENGDYSVCATNGKCYKKCDTNNCTGDWKPSNCAYKENENIGVGCAGGFLKKFYDNQIGFRGEFDDGTAIPPNSIYCEKNNVINWGAIHYTCGK